jgi:hypothetical protein
LKYMCIRRFTGMILGIKIMLQKLMNHITGSRARAYGCYRTCTMRDRISGICLHVPVTVPCQWLARGNKSQPIHSFPLLWNRRTTK